MSAITLGHLTAILSSRQEPLETVMPQSTSARAPTAASRHPPRNHSQKYIELRPKEGGLLIKIPKSHSDFKRQKHALSQKNQRDRLKTAFDQMAHVLSTSGVDNGRKRGLYTKVDLIETAVEYIQYLQTELNEGQNRKLSEG
ncbi:hypothetical protein BDV26DRAFT_295972 [Aspergillus bertholletiae]|uniref:BHLH domain-containing protein n=1 Tax=Aspergillus bertholletiae TaxID=1226010 RepID=A0A5N7AXG0_9EURO|nr:hypothetical protein BDV26DRAFT_295972 [Aspergillus bertholletiae]